MPIEAQVLVLHRQHWTICSLPWEVPLSLDCAGTMDLPQKADHQASGPEEDSHSYQSEIRILARSLTMGLGRDLQSKNYYQKDERN